MAARMGVWLSSNRHAEGPDEEKNIIKIFNLSSWGVTRLKFLRRHMQPFQAYRNNYIVQFATKWRLLHLVISGP